MKRSLIIKVLKTICIGLIASMMLYLFTRVCLFDRFIVKGESMNPTYEDGTPVYVCKLLFGARIYKDFNFAKSSLKSFRLPGLRRIKVLDVVMMNYPYARCKDSINFDIGSVYMKRCLGCPGDTVRISNGYYIHPYSGTPIDLGKYSTILSETPDSALKERGVILKAFQLNRDLGWTIRNFGPLYVPAKGDILKITTKNLKTYRKLIHYETGRWPDNIKTYEFKTNWYFLGGDNILNSRDSRYFGLVPEEYIIGIVI